MPAKVTVPADNLVSVATRPLPDFERPPLNEVALSIQFEPLANFQVHHYGLFWSRINGRYPRVETHGTISRQIERFGPAGEIVFPKIELVEEPLFPRAWFVSESGTELIQLQRDRITYNWRRVLGSEEYPRYGHVRERFIAELEVFKRFITDEQLGEISLVQCEVTYVNHVPAEGQVVHPASGAGVFRCAAALEQHPDLPEFEGNHLVWRFLMRGRGTPDAPPIGRLYAEIGSATYRKTGDPIFVFNLVARGAPLSEGEGGALEFFDSGREVIVRAFAALTTPEMHAHWGRRDG